MHQSQMGLLAELSISHESYTTEVFCRPNTLDRIYHHEFSRGQLWFEQKYVFLYQRETARLLGGMIGRSVKGRDVAVVRLVLPLWVSVLAARSTTIPTDRRPNADRQQPTQRRHS